MEINNIKISRATVDDAEGIQILTAEASKGMYGLCGLSEDEVGNYFNPDKIKEGVDKLRKAISIFTDSDILFVAKDEGEKIIGYCFAERQDNINRIEAVYVSSDAQGLGLGSKVYNEAYKFLNHKNDTFLEVFSLNSKAIGFYKKLGFIETGKKIIDERFAGLTGKILEATEMMLPGKR
jgi:ribosomal protein S18 acetylase RimI-like enzyme